MNDPQTHARTKPWLLYGANGYTGELIAEEAARRGLRPVLAARRKEAVEPMAERLGLQYRVFELRDPAVIAAQLDDVAAVLLCAGPFAYTSRPMVEACLRAGVHYLDITGEIEVFEAVHARTAEAAERGVVLLPGVGFDVVPSDCLAKALHERLPDAIRLELAFAGGDQASHGTAKTMVDGLPRGGAIRKAGVITSVPLAHRTAHVPFRDRTRLTMAIPWGDVSTAYYSTGIPNIVVYMAASPAQIAAAKLTRVARPLLASAVVRRALVRRIERAPRGPSAERRARGRAHLFGRVENMAGASVSATLETPEGYALTVQAALACLERLLAGPDAVTPGAHTPSTAFGASFVSTLSGCDLRLE